MIWELSLLIMFPVFTFLVVRKKVKNILNDFV